MTDPIPTPSPSVVPTTMKPSVMTPAPTVLPTTFKPTTAAPTTAAPTTVSPTTAPHRHHFSKVKELEIDSSVIIGFVFVCAAALLYKKRRKIPLYLMRLKYYLCCCRLSPDELLEQQEEHATLNDFLFEVNRNEDVGRVNVSEITHDDDEGESGIPVREVSIQSLFPDLLGQEINHQREGQVLQSLAEPLLSQSR